MSLFEYMSIATSLILSFSVARMLTNLAPIFATGRRYWVHITWVVLLLFNHVTLFWQLWLYQPVQHWTLVSFVLLLVSPTMLLIATSLLVPEESVPDYRDYFESIRRPAYWLLIVTQVQQIPLLYLLFGIPLVSPLHLDTVVVVCAFLAGIYLRKSSADMVLVCFFTFAVAGGLMLSNDHETTREFLESWRD